MDHSHKAGTNLLLEVRYHDGKSGTLLRTAFLEERVQMHMEEGSQNTNNIAIEWQV